MPPFTIFTGSEVEASTSLQYLKEAKSANRIRYCVDVELGNALLTGLMNAGFDPADARQTRYLLG
jgi:hypothetical protein